MSSLAQSFSFRSCAGTNVELEKAVFNRTDPTEHYFVLHMIGVAALPRTVEPRGDLQREGTCMVVPERGILSVPLLMRGDQRD